MFIKSIACFVSAILLLQLSSSAASPDVNPDMLRIVGGQATTAANVPYAMQLYDGSNFRCGATLVRPLFAVTAAQCVSGSRARDFTVVGGATRLNDVGVRRGVALIIRPSGYSNTNRKMDVAVLKLESAMTGTNIATIGLNSVPLRADQVMHVSGWGLTNENAANPPGQLRHMLVPIIARARCQSRYQGVMTIPTTTFCAAKPGVKDHCFGDTGGPAECNGKLCGIVSTSIGCARANRPGLYIGVRAVRSFILRAMQN